MLPAIRRSAHRGGAMGNRRSWLVLPALLLCAVVIAACGSSSSSSSSGSSSSSSATSAPTPAADPAAEKLVPASIKSKGTLTVASDASYPPDEFFALDGHTVIGMDADLIKAIAAVMGMKASVQNAVFDSIIPGLASKKYDVGIS